MTIRLLEGIQLAGVHQAVGSILTLTADAEARLVTSNKAVYTTLPSIGNDGVPVMATKNVTGGSRLSVAESVPATFIPIGDSRTANGFAGGVSNPLFNARGYTTHLQVMLGGRINLLRNAGVSGNTSADMLARIDADVIAYAPGWCFLEGPVNDIVLGTMTLAETISNIKAMYAKCSQAGIRFATGTISAFTNINTATEKAYHSAYNSWVKDWCQKAGIPCADEFAATAIATTGLPATNTTYDTNHFSDYGAGLVARAWFAVLDPAIPFNNFVISQPYDYGNLVYNGAGGWTVGAALPTGWAQFTGSAGAPANTTEVRPDIYQGSVMQCVGTAAAQGAYIGVTRSANDRIATAWAASTAYVLGDRRIANDGNQYVCTTAGTTAGTQPAWSSTVGSTTTDNTVTWTRYENFNAGDVCYFECEVWASNISGGALGFMPVATAQAQGVSGNVTVLYPTDQATKVAINFDGYYVLRSASFTIPAGCTGYIPLIYAYMDNGVTATLKVGRVAIRHVQ